MEEIQEYKKAKISSEEAWHLERKVKEYRLHMNIAFWKMLETLDYARSVKIWNPLGYDSWGSWLAQEGIALQTDTINRYLRGFRALRRTLQPPELEKVYELPRSKVLLIANKVTPENAEEMVTKAKELSYSDLRMSLNPDPEETIDRPPKPKFRWCHFHEKWKVMFGSLDDVCDC